MKILIFAPYYLPHNYGITVCVDEFAKFISPKVEEIIIITPYLFKNSLKEEIKYKNVKIIRFPAFYLVFNYPVPKMWKADTWKIIGKLIKNRREYDFIITTIRFFLITFFGAFFAKIFKIKLIHIEQVANSSILSSRFKMLSAKLFDHTLGKLVFRMADVNIAPSTDVKVFINKFDKRKVEVIFNSLNVEEIEKISLNLKIKEKYKNKIIICYPGRLCKWKGIEDSVEVVKSLPQKIKDKIVFLILGDGEDFKRIQKMSTGEESIILMGEMTREKVIGILKVSDIYLHSVMHGGGLSNSLLEAMYCKCTVIATPNEGAKDIINGNNGVLVYSKDEMKKVLADLIENEGKRKELGERAKETIETEFKWEKSILEYWELIKKI